jgi:hypothetical protein
MFNNLGRKEQIHPAMQLLHLLVPQTPKAKSLLTLFWAMAASAPKIIEAK